MLRLISRTPPLRPLALAIALIGVVAATVIALVQLDQWEETVEDERIDLAREVQEGLSALHLDLQMINHLAAGHGGGPTAAQDYIAARRTQLAPVRWLGILAAGREKPEVLLAALDMRGYDPRRDSAVTAALGQTGSLAAAIPGSHRDLVSLALVLSPADAEDATLVALIDGNQLLDSSIGNAVHATAPFELLLQDRVIGRARHVPHHAPVIPVDTRALSLATLEFTLAFAGQDAAAILRRILPLPLVLLAGTLAVAVLVVAAGRLSRPSAPQSPAPPPPAVARTAGHEHFRARLWQLGELAASLSHDLGQPLNVIRLTAEAAQDAIDRGRLDPARLRRTLDSAVEQTLRAQGMLAALMAATRRPSQASVPLRPVEAVRQVLSRNLASLKGQGIRLVWHGDPSAPSVRGHADRLEAAIQHLLTNACEAVAARADAAAEGVVQVECRRDGDGVAISVGDNGPGFPPALRPLIEDPLAPVPDRGKGCGLGLTVILGVVAEMGGTVTVSEAQPGTRVTLLLPPARRSLLLVEDDAAAAAALTDHLTASGWDVRVAPGGNPALTMFMAERSDAVITDLHMADGDGWQLIERLRALEPDLPLIAVSTADDHGCRRAVALGATLVLRKPLGIKEISDGLEESLADLW